MKNEHENDRLASERRLGLRDSAADFAAIAAEVMAWIQAHPHDGPTTGAGAAMLRIWRVVKDDPSATPFDPRRWTE